MGGVIDEIPADGPQGLRSAQEDDLKPEFPLILYLENGENHSTGSLTGSSMSGNTNRQTGGVGESP
jgi:hypothetical protein